MNSKLVSELVSYSPVPFRHHPTSLLEKPSKAQLSFKSVAEDKSVAEERGYDTIRLSGGYCYMWSKQATRFWGRDYSEVFELRLRQSPIRYWPGDMHPYVNFLQHHRGKLDRSRIENAVQTIKRDYRQLPKKPKKRATLFSERDALQKQLERDVKRLCEPLSDIKSILKVLVAEQSPDKGPYGFPFTENIRWLWKRVAGGLAAEGVREEMRGLLEMYEVPSNLAKMQTSGVMHSLRARDKVLETAVRIHDRWWVYEKCAASALLNEQLPKWKKIEQEIQRSQGGRDSRNADHKIRRRLSILARELLVRNEAGQLVIHPQWKEAHATELFDEVAKGDHSVKNGENLSRSVRNRMNKDPLLPNAPKGRGAEKWVPVLKDVLQIKEYRIPKSLFDEM